MSIADVAIFLDEQPDPPVTAQEGLAFAQWLREHEIEILPNNSARQVLRYQLAGGEPMAVMLMGENGHGVLCNRTLARHLAAFRRGGIILMRGKRRTLARRKYRLARRDGDSCCICGQALRGDATIEHWVATSLEGPNEDHNLGLAHKRCNEIVDTLPVSLKIKVRDALRAMLPAQWTDPRMFPPRAAIWELAGISKNWQPSEVINEGVYVVAAMGEPGGGEGETLRDARQGPAGEPGGRAAGDPCEPA